MKALTSTMKAVAVGCIVVCLGLFFIGDSRATLAESKAPEQSGEVEAMRTGHATQEPEYAPGELIVKLKDGKTLDDIKDLNDKYKVTKADKVFKESPDHKKTLEELKAKLKEGYKIRRDEGLRMAEDFRKVDLEGWDEY